MSASHSRIPQALNEWNVRLEVLDLFLHFHGYFLTGWDLFEMFNTLKDRLERIADILFQLFGVDCGERIVHPTVVPLLPVGSCKPHIFKRLKVFDQAAKLIILSKFTENTHKSVENFRFVHKCYSS